MTIFFLKQLLSGSKKFVKCSEVKYIYVPQYKGLNVEKFLAMTKDFPKVLDYLPDSRDWHKLPRQWLVNVFYSVIGQPFADFINEVVEARNEGVAEKQDLMIEMVSQLRCVHPLLRSY